MPVLSLMRKLAIVGSHPDTRDNAPFDDGEFDIWVFNEAAMANPIDTPDDPSKHWCKRWTACFQMHKPEIYTSLHNRSNKNHWNWLQQDHGNRKIYMQGYDDRIPNSVAYPLTKAIELTGEEFFTSSFAYALALAVLMDYQYIEIYGSDLVSNTEYTYQAEGFKFWLGFLRGRGITVKMKCWPTAFIQPLYGYEGEIQHGSSYYQERADKLNAEWQAAEKSLTNIKKSILKHIERMEWDKVKNLIASYQESAMACGALAGAMGEAERYAAYGNRAIYRQEYEHSMASAQKSADKSRIMTYHTSGMVEYVWNVVAQTGNGQAIRQMTEFIGKMGEHAYNSGAMNGVFSENGTYMGLFDGLTQAAGGRKSLELLHDDN